LESLGFSSFRKIMDNWDAHLLKEADEDKLNALFDGLGIILFFEKDKEIFGSGEDGRVVFAKLKNPDDDLPSGWEDEASFSAHNLSKIAKGETAQHVFNKESLKDIQVLDKEEAVDQLRKELGDIDIQISHISGTFDKDPAEAPNFINAKEKK